MNRDDIQKLGAQAAREGLTLLDCPYYQAEALPDQTVAALAEWRGRVEAWEAGFRSEVNSREPVGGAPPPGKQQRSSTPFAALRGWPFRITEAMPRP